ncbi:MAG: ABC transporter permease [Gammaproteobacteria bacterium]|jgi:ABC-2 type transport system permease protein
MWQRIIALMFKELLTLLKDPKSRFVVIGPPIIQVLIFGYAATFDLNHIPYAILNQDHGAASRALVARFDGSPSFERVATLTRPAQLASLVERRDALLVVHLPQDFSSRLERGESAPVQIIIDGRNSNTAMIARNYASQIVDGFSRQWASDHGLPAAPAVLEVRAWFNPNLESRWFFLPGIVGLITFIVTMAVTSMSVAREREVGTFDQLLVTPLRPWEVIAGKALPGLLIGLFEATLILLIAVLWFHIPLRGSLLTLYSGIFLFLLSAIGAGLFLSALAVTLQQALLGTFLFIMPAVILSGFATPIANMPAAVQYLTFLDPLRYFMVVIRGVFLEATPFHLLIGQFVPMLLLGLGTMAIAGWLFRHRMY